MLVHICCSVDSHFFLQKLQKDYPQERLVGFFYDPNIHPYLEYKLRLLDVERSCKKLGIELLEGEYDYTSWLESVKGLEQEREKGARCAKCFDFRFERSMQKAKELGLKKITTSLLVSPLKSQEQLIKSGLEYQKKYGVEFIHFDYRVDGGTQKQSQVSKKEQLYRQDYCGCIYGLKMQRDDQNRVVDELFSPINRRVLPSSVEQKLELYTKRIDLEENFISYKIIKEKFLNYREFFLKTAFDTKISPSYALYYSTLPSKKTNGYIEFIDKNIAYLNRQEVKFITLEYFNNEMKSNYSSISELIFNPPSLQEEIALRFKISGSFYNLDPIIVVQNLDFTKVSIELDSIVYEDTLEKLIII